MNLTKETMMDVRYRVAQKGASAARPRLLSAGETFLSAHSPSSFTVWDIYQLRSSESPSPIIMVVAGAES